MPNLNPTLKKMLLLFFISCLSFIICYKFIQLKHFLRWTSEMRFVSLFFWKDLPILTITRFINTSLSSSIFSAPFKLSFTNESLSSKVVNCPDFEGDDCYHRLHSSSGCSNAPTMDLLDLPDLVLECILERLPMEGLRSMASVCCSMQERCMSHMKQKWEKVAGPGAYKSWQFNILLDKKLRFSNQAKLKRLINWLVKLWPVSLVRSSCHGSNSMMMINYNSMYSDMSWYLALERGNFWFHAQVYNIKNGKFGFILSCDDADLCYDGKTDTFQVSYPPHRIIKSSREESVTWDRVRSARTDDSSHCIHNSDCLNELRPGDHIEIQWRKMTLYPYVWRYGIVGHLELCNGNGIDCLCAESDIMSLEFIQYAPGRRWIQKIIRRKDQRVEGNAEDGCFAGIRKLKDRRVISKWNHLKAMLTSWSVSGPKITRKRAMFFFRGKF